MEITTTKINVAPNAVAKRTQQTSSRANNSRQEPAAATVQNAQKSEDAVSRKELEKFAENLERTFDVNIQVAVDQETGRDIVKILSSDGKRLIRQIPAEAALKMAHKAKSGQLDGLLDSLV